MPGRDGRRLSPETLHIMRRKAVEAIEAGELSQTEAATVFGVSRSTVAAWMKSFREGGPAALHSRRKGRPAGSAVARGMGGDLVRFVMENLPPGPEAGAPLLWTRDRLTAAVAAHCGLAPSRWTVQRLFQHWGLALPPQSRELLAHVRQDCARLLSAGGPAPGAARRPLAAPPVFLLRCLPCPVPATPHFPALDGYWLAAVAPRGTVAFCGMSGRSAAPQAIPAFLLRLARHGGPGPLLLLPEAGGAFRRVMLAWLRQRCRCLPLTQPEHAVVYLLHPELLFTS